MKKVFVCDSEHWARTQFHQALWGFLPISNRTQKKYFLTFSSKRKLFLSKCKVKVVRNFTLLTLAWQEMLLALHLEYGFHPYSQQVHHKTWRGTPSCPPPKHTVRRRGQNKVTQGKWKKRFSCEFTVSMQKGECNLKAVLKPASSYVNLSLYIKTHRFVDIEQYFNCSHWRGLLCFPHNEQCSLLVTVFPQGRAADF